MKPKQGEFAGMPERTKLGQAVIEYLNAKARLIAVKEDVSNAQKACFEHFRASGRNAITVENNTVFYRHEAKDKLVVRGKGASLDK